jgi:hypothetical protein
MVCSKLSTVPLLFAIVSTFSPKVTLNVALNPIVAVNLEQLLSAWLCYVHSLNPFAYFWLWKAKLFKNIF